MTLGERRGADPHVYEAAEDSALLAAAATRSLGAPGRVLDVGTGSGYVARRLADAGHDVVGSDVNPHACRRARDAGIPAVRCDLTAGFRDGVFDAVTFNPPYLPSIEDVDEDGWFAVAVTGGPAGRAVIRRFIHGVARVLAPGGRVFVLVSSLTDIGAVRDLARDAGFESGVIEEDDYPGEVLAVLELTPT